MEKARISLRWHSWTVIVPGHNRGLGSTVTKRFTAFDPEWTCTCERFRKHLEKKGLDCAHIEFIKQNES